MMNSKSWAAADNAFRSERNSFSLAASAKEMNEFVHSAAASPLRAFFFFLFVLHAQIKRAASDCFLPPQYVYWPAALN
jgi:hypothetical protein